MNEDDCQVLGTRVLVLAPTGKDAEGAHAILTRVGIACVNCADELHVCEQLTAGAGAVLIAEESVHGVHGGLTEWLGRQPSWSDLPVLVLTRAGVDSPAVARALDAFGNVTIIDRPARVSAWVSAIQSALRARRRQYRVRDELLQRQRNAERLDTAMAADDAGRWQVNLTTGEFSASDRAIELYGLPPGTHLNHERALACVHPADRASVEAALRLTFECGQPFRHEHRVTQPDGSVRWMSSHAQRQVEGDQTFIVGLMQDITERRLAKDALQYSERLHRIAFDQSPTGMVYVGTDGRFTKVNPAMCEIAGYAADELAGMLVSDLTHPDDRARDAERLDPFLRGCTPTYQNEKRYVRKDGSVRWVTATARMVTDAEGRPLHSVGVVLDITARKRAEAESESAQWQIATTLESITEGFIRFDRDWRVVYMNEEAERINQRPRAETLGKTLWELYPAALGTTLEADYRRCVAEQVTIEFEYRYEMWDRWFAQKLYPTPDGGLVVYFRDITDRKRVEQVLAGRTELLNGVLDGTTDVIFAKDLDGRLLLANAAFAAAARSSPEQLVRKTDSDWFPPDVAATVRQQDKGVIVSESPVQFEETIPVAGEVRTFLTLKAPLRDGSSRIVGLLGIGRDITDRKRAERLEDAQRRVLELIATDAPLPNVLATVCRLIEDQEPGLVCSLLLPDEQGRYIELAAGASLPGTYLRGLESLPICPPYIGTCGAALDRGEVFVAPDVAADERFAPEWRALLLRHDLRACRSIPVSGLTGKVLASLALYRREPGDPEPANKQLVQLATFLTGIAIQRHQAEQALRTSEERFRTLFESMDEGFCIVEMAFDEAGGASDYRVLETNPAFEKHTGMSGLVGKSMREAIPDLEEFWYETYGRVAATGEPARFVRAAGPMDGRWFDVHAFRIGGAGSIKVAILFNDITSSRHAQETLMASDARNSFLVTLADTLRPLSNPIDVQAEASRVLGERLGANRVAYFEIRGNDHVIERDYIDKVPSIVGRHPIASFGPDPLAALRSGRTASEADVDAMQALTPEEKATYVSVQIRAFIGVPLVKDGKLVAGLGVHSASVRAWTPTEIAMAEDTAERTWAAVERVRAEAQLQTSEMQRDLALDAAGLGTWHVDMATRLTTTDARFRAIFGITEERMDYLQLFSVIHPDDRAAVERSVAAASRLENPELYSIEYRINRPDGTVRWVFGKGATNHREKEGKKIFSFDGTVQDITARKCIEQEREQLVIQLRDADRHKDEFLATLAHELRNPLAPLRNGLQLIRLAGVDGTVERARSMMDRQLTQLVRMVDDLMDVSRVTSGKFELRKGRAELRAVLDAAVETSQPAIEQAGLELAVVVPDESILLDADSTRLAQVVSNLLNNSAKYTHRGGHVRLTAWREDGTAVVSVKDDGIGIPPAMLGRVFEKFLQVNRALEKTTGGLGIGLSLVKGLVEMHDGTVEARSDGEGLGSEFLVRLPVAMAVVPWPVRLDEHASETVPAALRRILVVDDNVDAADSLGQLLEMFGNAVRVANDGEAGIAVATQFRPDVVLMDIGMPKLNGYEAARRIRQHPWGQDMVLVALTGWGQDDDRKKSADAGFDHHLVKPVETDALLRLIASL